MKRILFFLLLALPAAGLRAATVDQISQQVDDGHWRQAQQEIAGELSQTNLEFQTRQALLFQRDRMARMRLDFSKPRDQVLREARATVPAITEEQFAAWEKTGAVECLDIDGTRWYFGNAAANLFRINPEARALKLALYPKPASAELYRPEVAMLPIGGHFTMGPKEAALAARYLEPKIILPIHYGTIPELKGTPEELAAVVDAKVQVVRWAPGESI